MPDTLFEVDYSELQLEATWHSANRKIVEKISEMFPDPVVAFYHHKLYEHYYVIAKNPNGGYKTGACYDDFKTPCGYIHPLTQQRNLASWFPYNKWAYWRTDQDKDAVYAWLQGYLTPLNLRCDYCRQDFADRLALIEHESCCNK